LSLELEDDAGVGTGGIDGADALLFFGSFMPASMARATMLCTSSSLSILTSSTKRRTHCPSQRSHAYSSNGVPAVALHGKLGVPKDGSKPSGLFSVDSSGGVMTISIRSNMRK